jgi:hypothetical protein
MDVLTFALFDVPYAAVRRHLAANQSPPARLDPLITTASFAVLDAHQPATIRRR